VHRLLRLGVLAAAPWPLAYACATPALARAYPRKTAIRVLYLTAYVAAGVLCAVLVPLLLLPFAMSPPQGRLWGCG